MSDPSKPSAEADLAAKFQALEDLFPVRVEEVLEAIDPLIAEADASGDQVIRWRCLLLKGNSLLYLGRVDEVATLLDGCEPEIRRQGHARLMAGLLNLRAVIADRRSAHDEAIHFLQEGMEFARELGETPVLANLTTNMGLDFAYLGEYGSALAVLEEALEMWRRAGEPAGIIPTLINLGMTCDKAGQTDLAIRHFDEALARSRAAGDVRRTCICLVNLATIHAKGGDYPTSALMAEEALDLSSHSGDPRVLAHALAATVPAAIGIGDQDAARAALNKALQLYETAKLERGIAVTALDLAEMDSTEPAEARALSLRALEIAQAAKLRGEEARARGCLARLAKAEGAWREALIETEAARALERQLYNEETQRRTQAVRVRRVVEDLNRELARERRERDEVTLLLEAVNQHRAAAEEASRQKTALLGIAAHDLRSGLSGVIGSLDMALDFIATEAPAEETRAMLDLASRAAGDVFAMLLRLIDHAAIERGEMSSHPEELDIQKSLSELLAGWSRDLAAKQQTVTVRCLDETILIHVDPSRWVQVFSNLLSNAIKYSPLGGVIEVVVRAIPEDWVRIEFCDRGPGISDLDQGQMFRPFQTLSAQPTGGELATGLGLHIVKGIVENEGGRIGYLRRDGGGSVFWIEFRRVG